MYGLITLDEMHKAWKNEKKRFGTKQYNISIISGRCLAFPYLIFSKASVYNRLISPHWILIVQD